MVETKSSYVTQLLEGTGDTREFEEDTQNSFSYAEVKAIASGNPIIKEKFEVDNEVVPNDEYGWYLGSMSSCRVGEYAILGEMVLDDRDEFKEKYYDYNCDELDKMFPRDCENGDAELEKYLDKIADENFKTAIIVSISPYSE